jgi:hypothetical protein
MFAVTSVAFDVSLTGTPERSTSGLILATKFSLDDDDASTTPAEDAPSRRRREGPILDLSVALSDTSVLFKRDGGGGRRREGPTRVFPIVFLTPSTSSDNV